MANSKKEAEGVPKRKSFQVRALDRKREEREAEEKKYLGICADCDQRQGHKVREGRFAGDQPNVKVDCRMVTGGSITPPTPPKGSPCPNTQPSPIFIAARRKAKAA